MPIRVRRSMFDELTARAGPVDRDPYVRAIIAVHLAIFDGQAFDAREYVAFSEDRARLTRIAERMRQQRDGRPEVEFLVDLVEDGFQRRVASGWARTLEAMRDAVIVADMRQVVRMWNGGAERLFLWTAGEAIGQIAPDLLPSTFTRRQEQEQLRTVRDEGHFRAAGTWYAKGGAAVECEVEAQLLLDAQDEPCGYVGVFREAVTTATASTGNSEGEADG
jgi:PAS domain S-box-containing protein